jgi:hypothetical protein
MARRQLQIAGTERDEHPEVEEAGEAWREARKEAKAAQTTAKQKKLELIAVMQAHKVRHYKYTEADTGEEVLLTYAEEPKVSAKKTGEADSKIGEGLDEHDGDVSPGVHAGLIAQAERASDGSNTEVDGEGDVVVPDVAAPKSKKKRSKKASK